MNGFRKCGLFPWNPHVVHTFFPKTSKKDHTTNKKSSVGDQGDGYLDVKQFEKFIGKDNLDIFKQHAGEKNWEGPESDKSLFITWKKLLPVNNGRSTVEKKMEKKQNEERKEGGNERKRKEKKYDGE
ncbi:hypothetical protein JTB14_020241 [Gonioctena quinquepunctata]|nr:hypothetical protein JTB14_020241 [Gonioctena quinquepunctata]